MVTEYYKEKASYYEAECSMINRGNLESVSDICKTCIHNNEYMTKSGNVHHACTLRSDFEELYGEEV